LVRENPSVICRHRTRLSALGGSALAIILALFAASRAGRSQDPAAPTAQPIGASDLLRSEPFDRLTLIDNTVLFVEPVSPRPLPVIDPKKERERKKKADRNPGSLIEVGAIDKAKKDEPDDKEVEGLETVKLHLLQGGRNEVRDFQIKRSSLKTIEYFEDLLLAEAERLVLTRDFARAFECCLRVKNRNPAWPGLDDHVNRVLFAEGRRALVDGDDERGLRLLRELLGRKRDYPGLLEQIADAYGKRIDRALRMGLYLRGRRVLHELEGVTGELAAVRALRAVFVARASDRLKQGESAAPPERLDALTDALRIWPRLPGAEERYVRTFQEVPTLDVGVADVGSPLGPWVHSRADARVWRLLYRPVLASDDQEARQGKRPGQLAAAIETSDLGRRWLIRLRPGPLWSDGTRPVSATDVAESLIERSDPHSPSYDARWADLVDRVEIRDETRLELRLNHAPLKAGGWLLGPVGPAHAGIDGRIALSAKERVLVTNGIYTCYRSDADGLELRSREGSSEAAPRIRRVREIPMPRGLSAVTALRRGDVTLIDHVPPDQVASLAEAPEIQVGQYNKPVVHLIALDGRNPVLRSRALRRGLSYAIDRKGLLEDVVLKHPVNEVDAPADGPFTKGSYADAPGVKPLGFNPALARMLVVAAQKDLGVRAITLTFEYPAIPECRAAVAKLVEAFRLAGVQIQPVELPESRLERELRAGRKFDLAYRVLRCDDPIQDAGTLLCPAYDAPPEADPLAASASPRILQLLLELEHAGEWPTARGLAIQIDRESRDELAALPLWQLADHYAWRSRLRGPGPTTDDLYDHLDRWEISPWIARDPWDNPPDKPDAKK
jgi:peptide/nickel transport system substrate-binding protein